VKILSQLRDIVHRKTKAQQWECHWFSAVMLLKLCSFDTKTELP
jgi:hypothetical protein